MSFQDILTSFKRFINFIFGIFKLKAPYTEVEAISIAASPGLTGTTPLPPFLLLASGGHGWMTGVPPPPRVRKNRNVSS
jgi:hypothetical protein